MTLLTRVVLPVGIIFLMCFCAAVVIHFIDMKPPSFPWPRWIEHATNRYQTLLTGLAAVFVGYLSVIKISQQIKLQKDERISNQKFALRREFEALHDCRSVILSLTEMSDDFVNVLMADFSPDHKPFIPYQPGKVLKHHRKLLPRSIIERMENVEEMILKHNGYNGAQQGFMGQPGLLVAVKANSDALLRRIDEALAELESYIPPST